MGATPAAFLCVVRQRFNPRTRDGCDENILEYIEVVLVSIHAPVMGATFKLKTCLFSGSFNPRTRDGCDFCHWGVTGGYRVSIHAPVMGATAYGLSR